MNVENKRVSQKVETQVTYNSQKAEMKTVANLPMLIQEKEEKLLNSAMRQSVTTNVTRPTSGNNINMNNSS